MADTREILPKPGPLVGSIRKENKANFQCEDPEHRRDRVAMENFHYNAIYQAVQAPVDHVQKATAPKLLRAKIIRLQCPTAKNPTRQWRLRQDSGRGNVHPSLHEGNKATRNAHGDQNMGSGGDSTHDIGGYSVCIFRVHATKVRPLTANCRV
jgi:hypothetical protein